MGSEERAVCGVAAAGRRRWRCRCGRVGPAELSAREPDAAVLSAGRAAARLALALAIVRLELELRLEQQQQLHDERTLDRTITQQQQREYSGGVDELELELELVEHWRRRTSGVGGARGARDLEQRRADLSDQPALPLLSHLYRRVRVPRQLQHTYSRK